MLAQFGIERAEPLDHGRGHVRQEPGLDAELPRETDAATYHAAQHVAAPFVRGHNAVGDEERRAPGMLRHDVDGEVVVGVLSIRLVRQLLHAPAYRREQVGLVGGGHALHDGRHALQPHAGVDARRGQVRPRAVRRLVELGEDKVPVLEEPARVVARLRTGAVLFAEVVVELAGRAARAFVARRPPEVVLVAQRDDALVRHADLVAPYRPGLVISGVHRDPYAFRGQQQHAGGELPRPGDRLALEVVAYAEVAQHLEHRVVREVAHLVYIGGAEALLHGREARVRRRLVPGVVGFERRHARRRKKQCGVACRDQRRAWHYQVAALLKESQICGADIVAGRGGHVRQGRTVLWEGAA